MMARTPLSPAELSRDLDAASDAWHTLRNEAVGRGLDPRPLATAKQRAIRDKLVADHDEFFAWRDRLTGWDAVWIGYGSELAERVDIYRADRDAWFHAMGKTSAPPLFQLEAAGAAVARKVEDIASTTADLGLLALVVVGVVLVVSSNKKSEGRNGAS